MTMGIFWLMRNCSIHSMLSRSRWLVGSSNRRRLGSVSRILPRPIRIFHPPLKDATRLSPSSTEKPMRSMIFSTLLASWATPIESACFWRSAMRSSASCILSGSSLTSSSTLSKPSSSSKTFISSAKTLMSSSFRVRDSTSSSTNSCLRNEMRRSAALLMTSPDVGSSSPYMTRSCVVFPPPFAPTSPTRSPVCTPQEQSVHTCWFLKMTLTLSRRTDT
mmetsp:Transcript_17506/g.44056  ORF Transcript_17506/g.44056 Transcript_17506/m.44056 type:complete len:219 (-) Transcript_17506:102-758(-)